MLVSELITILQTCNPDATVLTDKNNTLKLSNPFFMSEVMGQSTIVAQGIAYRVFIENCNTNFWVTQENWRYQPPGVPLDGTPSVYIGSGISIVGPMWDKKFEQ